MDINTDQTIKRLIAEDEAAFLALRNSILVDRFSDNTAADTHFQAQEPQLSDNKNLLMKELAVCHNGALAYRRFVCTEPYTKG